MKYFTLRELTKSGTAVRKGIDNTPDKVAILNLNKLVDNVLDPLREAYNKPIKVTSGYRCPAVNRLSGGAATSQHMSGLAADITTTEDTFEKNKELFDLILKLNLPYDLLIWEYGTDIGPDWIHVSFGPKNRKKILRAKKLSGKTVYTDITNTLR